LIGPKADPDELLPNGVPEPRPFPLGTIAYGRLFEYILQRIIQELVLLKLIQL
jgi:hypothetical protein